MKRCPVCTTPYPNSKITCDIDRVLLIESKELDPGTIINNKWEIVRTLGEGGMGIVYLARHIHTSRLRALKFLHRDTRIIVASQSEIKGMVSTGKLRPDLYQAVGNLEIRIAPLRERLDDLELISIAMLRRHHCAATFDEDALLRLRACTWPGNLKELGAFCEKLHKSGVITAQDLPLLGPPAPPAPMHRLEEVMHRHVLEVLQSCSGNKLRAAELLGISRSTLYRMLDSQTTTSV